MADVADKADEAIRTGQERRTIDDPESVMY